MNENQENQPPPSGCGGDVPQSGLLRGRALLSKRRVPLKISQVALHSRGAQILRLSNSSTPSQPKRCRIDPDPVGTRSPCRQVPLKSHCGVFSGPVSLAVEYKSLDLRSPQVPVELPHGVYTSPVNQSMESTPIDLRSPQARVRLKLFQNTDLSQPAPGNNHERILEWLDQNNNGPDLPEQHQQDHKPPPPTPESILSASIEEPVQVQDHIFLDGRDGTRGVHFLVKRDTKVVSEEDITNYYFISPGYHPICLRTTLSISMKHVWRYVKQNMSLVMENAIISFKGTKVPLTNTLEDYQKNSTFTIHDNFVPPEYLMHLGKLWQCLSCQNPGYDAKKSFKGRKEKCKNGNAHRFFCQENIPKSWGHITGDKRKSTKPWGCPFGIRGPKNEQDQDDSHQSPRASTGVKLPSPSGSTQRSDQECDSSQIQPRPDPSIIREPPAGLQSSSFVGAIEPLPGPSSRPCIQDQDDSYQSPRASTGVKLPSSSGIPQRSDQEFDSPQIQPRPDPSNIREPHAGLESMSFVGGIEPLPGPSSRPDSRQGHNKPSTKSPNPKGKLKRKIMVKVVEKLIKDPVAPPTRACIQPTSTPAHIPEGAVVARTRGKIVDYYEEPLDEVDQVLKQLEEDVHSGDEYEPATSSDDSESSDGDFEDEDSQNDSVDPDGDDNNGQGSTSCCVKREVKVSAAVSTREYLTNNPPETDDEEDDIESLRQARKLGQQTLRLDMQAKKDEMADIQNYTNRYIADDRDKELLAQHITRPLLKSSERFQRFEATEQREVIDLVERGVIPTAKTGYRGDVVYTPIPYLRSLKLLLGEYQEELRTSMPQKLVDGRLHLWQMMEEYKSANHIPFPSVVLHLLDKISKNTSPSNAKFALACYCTLIDSTIVFLCKPEGQKQFMKKSPKELRDYPDAESQIDFEQFVDTQIENFKMKLQNIRRSVTVGKPYSKYQMTIEQLRQEKNSFVKEFQGKEEPLAASAVPMYMKSEGVRKFYMELGELAMKKSKVTPRKLLDLGRMLVKMWHLKQGHRIEWVNKFLYGDWIKLVNGGSARYPYVLADQASGMELKDPAVKSRLKKHGQATVYTRPDPHNPDPLVPECEQQEDQDLVMGMAVVLEGRGNKVSKYPLIIWLSNIDVTFGRCYESLRRQVLEDLGLDPEDPSLPFFINTKGEKMIHPNSPSLKWTDFELIAGCGPVTSHVARKMQSQFITNSRNTLLLQCREFMMNHSEEIDKRFYQNSLRERDMAKIGQAIYRTNLGLEEERNDGQQNSTEGPLCVDEEQLERERRGQKRSNQIKFDNYLLEEARRDAQIKPTLTRLIGNRVKLALVQGIMHCKDRAITSKGAMCDLFMTGIPVVNKKNASILLRMVQLMYTRPDLRDGDLSCFQILSENLLEFVGLSDPVSSLRMIEWKWSIRCLDVLSRLQTTATLGSQNLINALAVFNQEQDNSYCFGNIAIWNLVVRWQGQKKVRESKLVGTEAKIGLEDFLASRRVQLRDQPRQVVHEIQLPQGQRDEGQAEGVDHLVGHDELDQFEGKNVELVHNEERTSKLWPAHKPSPRWDDELKLEFLKQYMINAPDPLKRSPPQFSKGKSAYKSNLLAMEQAMVEVTMSGENFLLFSLVSSWDTLAQFLQFKGLEGQKKLPAPQSGLLALVDLWIEEQADRSMQNLREKADQLVEFARHYY